MKRLFDDSDRNLVLWAAVLFAVGLLNAANVMIR